jgi:hypothetical protein
MFRPGSRLRRRPSASMVVATLALFIALSGGAYAAVVIPNDSVGFNQLRPGAVAASRLANNAVITPKVANDAITYTKIAPGQIGHVRVAQNQIQWRVNGRCSGSSAVQSITATGGTTCASTLSNLYTTPGLTEPLTSPTAATLLASEALPAGPGYLLRATPYVEVKGSAGAQNVDVTCEIAAGSVTESRTATLALTTASEQETAEIPLSIVLPAQGSATEAAVACNRSYDTSTAPVVQASSDLLASPIAANVAIATPGTSTTVLSLTTPTPSTTTTSTTTTTTTVPTTTTPLSTP